MMVWSWPSESVPKHAHDFSIVPISEENRSGRCPTTIKIMGNGLCTRHIHIF